MDLEEFIALHGWNTAGDFEKISWTRAAHLENTLTLDLSIWPFWLAENLRKENMPLRLVFNNVVSMSLDWSDLNTELIRICTVEVDSKAHCRSVPPSLQEFSIESDHGESIIVCHSAQARTDF